MHCFHGNQYSLLKVDFHYNQYFADELKLPDPTGLSEITRNLEPKQQELF